MSDLVNLQNARPGVYTDVIASIAEKKICPFCPEHVHEIHEKPIVDREFWLVTDNMYPYQPTKQCRLYIHREHIESLEQISAAAWTELRSIIKVDIAERQIVGGSFFLRFGDTRFTGSSVVHLHAHLLQSNPDDPSYDPDRGVMTRLG